MNLLLTLLKDAPITRNVMIAYNLDNNRGVQLTDMGYVTDTPGEGKRLTVKQAKEQFKYACMRVHDNLLTGEVGYVRDTSGIIYAISHESKTAKPIARYPY